VGDGDAVGDGPWLIVTVGVDTVGEVLSGVEVGAVTRTVALGVTPP